MWRPRTYFCNPSVGSKQFEYASTQLSQIGFGEGGPSQPIGFSGLDTDDDLKRHLVFVTKILVDPHILESKVLLHFTPDSFDIGGIEMIKAKIHCFQLFKVVHRRKQRCDTFSTQVILLELKLDKVTAGQDLIQEPRDLYRTKTGMVELQLGERWIAGADALHQGRDLGFFHRLMTAG